MESLTSRSQSDRKHGGLDDEVGEESDRCNKEAYFGGGAWWLDRWLVGKSGILFNSVTGSVSSTGRGENVAVAICNRKQSLQIVSARNNNLPGRKL